VLMDRRTLATPCGSGGMGIPPALSLHVSGYAISMYTGGP
jgi:hypothetical protein